MFQSFIKRGSVPPSRSKQVTPQSQLAKLLCEAALKTKVRTISVLVSVQTVHSVTVQTSRSIVQDTALLVCSG